jgi:hypothetical protein
MIDGSPLFCSSHALIWGVIQKAIAFQSFTGLTVQEFDDIYNKKMAKKYTKYEVLRHSTEQIKKETYSAVDRPFKLDLKIRFLMPLVCFVAWFNKSLFVKVLVVRMLK